MGSWIHSLPYASFPQMPSPHQTAILYVTHPQKHLLHDFHSCNERRQTHMGKLASSPIAHTCECRRKASVPELSGLTELVMDEAQDKYPIPNHLPKNPLLRPHGLSHHIH